MDNKIDFDDLQEMRSHISMVKHLQRSLYFQESGDQEMALESCSLPLTEVSVEQFRRAIESIHQPKSTVNVKFVARLTRMTQISPYSFLLALIYVERIKRKNPNFIKSTPPRELLLVSLLIASKYLYDDGEEEEVFNSEFASCGNLPVLKVNQIEKYFLNAIEWELFVEPNLFYQELLRIETLVMQLECRKRSNQTVTYAELHRFLKNDRIFQLIAVYIAKQMLRTVMLFSLAYAGVVLGTLTTTLCVLNARLLSLHLVFASQPYKHLNHTLAHLSDQSLFDSSTVNQTLKWENFKDLIKTETSSNHHHQHHHHYHIASTLKAMRMQENLKQAKMQQSQQHIRNQYQFVTQMLNNHNLTRELFQTPVLKHPIIFGLYDSRLQLI